MKSIILWPTDVAMAYSVFLKEDMRQVASYLKDFDDIICFPRAHQNINAGRYCAQVWHLKRDACDNRSCINTIFHNADFLGSMDSSIIYNFICNSIIILDEGDIFDAREDVLENVMFNYYKLRC